LRVAVLLILSCDSAAPPADVSPALSPWPAYCADDPDVASIPSERAAGALLGAPSFRAAAAALEGCQPGHETAGPSQIVIRPAGGDCPRVEVRFHANGNAPGRYVLGGPRRHAGLDVVHVVGCSGDSTPPGDDVHGVLVLDSVTPPAGRIGLCARGSDGRLLGVAGAF
jgi:hypothetical protein